MAADNLGISSSNTDVLPMLTDANPGFDSVLRGYDRAQVDSYLARLDSDVRAATAERDTAAARSADLAAQLASAQAQVESLRRQLRAATENVTPDNVDPHVNAILKAAQNDAATLRASAQKEAELVRNGAADAAARTHAAAQAQAERQIEEATRRQAQADDLFRQRMIEIDQHKTIVDAELAESLAQTRSEETELTRQSEAERNRLDAESAAERDRLETEAAAERNRLETESVARRALIDEDFELTLRIRRTKAYGEIDEQRATAKAEATNLVGEATRRSREMVETAQAEVDRLTAIRVESHQHLHDLHEELGHTLEQSIATIPEGG